MSFSSDWGDGAVDVAADDDCAAAMYGAEIAIHNEVAIGSVIRNFFATAPNSAIELPLELVLN